MFVNIVIHSGQAIGLLDAIITFISSFCDFMEGTTVKTMTGRDMGWSRETTQAGLKPAGPHGHAFLPMVGCPSMLNHITPSCY